MQYQLRISGRSYNELNNHLFPGDGKEAVALLLCGYHLREGLSILCVQEVFLIPYDKCERSKDSVHWKTELIIPTLEKASKNELSIIKIHSHPTGYPQFSQIDDQSDLELFPSLYGWTDGDQPHGSCVMLPGGKIFGRIINEESQFKSIDKILVADHQIKLFQQFSIKEKSELNLRNRQAFGEGTMTILKGMKVGVVGASGTGSPSIEQLVRLGVGEIVIIDPDIIEKKNLNRILNSTQNHAEKQTPKVDVTEKFIHEIGFNTIVKTFKENLYYSREAINELISCDVLFGCVDSIDGRHLLNQISTFYIIPYFDLGVKLLADGKGGIDQINAAVHYIQPGGSSLFSRGVYNARTLEAASLMRQDPEEYKKRTQEKYIVNLPVESPAVISINMQVSSFAINEFLDRIHPFKGTDPEERSISWISISENLILNEPDGEPDRFLEKRIGLGDIRPFLQMPEL